MMVTCDKKCDWLAESESDKKRNLHTCMKYRLKIINMEKLFRCTNLMENNMKTKEIRDVVEAEMCGEIIQAIFKGNICLEGNYWFLKKNNYPWDFIKYNYRIKPKEKIKLYQWAYCDNTTGWSFLADYFETEEDLRDSYNVTIEKIKRLDYTMIEVDAD